VSVAFPVSDIIERIRVRCGLPAFTTETNITTADIHSLVQESARALGGIVDDVSWHFVATATLVTTPGLEYVSVPQNFAALIQVHWDRGDGYPIALRQANLEDVLPASSEPTNWDARAPVYRLTGQTIELFPEPQAVYTLVVRYTTGIFLVETPPDTLMGQVDWDSWIIYDCACKIRERQEKDLGTFPAHREMLEQRIVRRARRRDRNGVRQPRDVRSHEVPHDHPWWRL
jgi:hypothetical protein